MSEVIKVCIFAGSGVHVVVVHGVVRGDAALHDHRPGCRQIVRVTIR